jgi:hypothetical protein
MRTSISLAVVLVFASSLFGFEEAGPTWRKAALSRRGVHHSSISGRFILPDGKPAPGVRVQLNSGNLRGYPFAATMSDADGRFRFDDVNAAATPGINWHPSQEWLNGAMAVAGESGEDVALGEIQLQPNTIIRVALEIVGGGTLDENSRRDPTVVLEGVPNGPRIVAERLGGFMLLQQIPFQEGRWDISIWSKDHAETFTGDFHVERGRRDQLLTIRLHRDTVTRVNEYLYQGKLEVSEVLLPEAKLQREFMAKGQLRNPDGTPVSGVVIGITDFFNRTAPVWTFSGANGEFELRYLSGECQRPTIQYSRDSFRAWDDADLYDPKDPKSCEKAWSSTRTLTMRQATRLKLRTSGAAPEDLRAYWWHPSFGWRPYSSMEPWVTPGGWPNSIAVKLDRPGFLPWVRRVKLPDVNAGKGEKPPEELVETFSFETGAVRELRVFSGGHPVPDAIVDVEWIEDLAPDTRLPLATYRTDASGMVRANDAGPQTTEVFVYARGFEPARAIWAPGAMVRLDLVPRNARLLFADLRPGYVARIRRAEQPESVRTVRCDYGRPGEIEVSAGTYDIVVYGDTGQVRGYQRIRVGAGETRSVDSTADQRPMLIVRYPDEGWSAGVTDSTPSGMSVGWAIYSSVGGQFAISDVAAVLERETQNQSVFRLSRAGRFHIQLTKAGRELSYWRTVAVSPGEELTIDAPQTEAALGGSMRTYDGGVGFSHHGWAGPRLELIADNPAAWSVTVFLPKRDGEHTFTLRDLPAGDYHLYQHLIGTPNSYKDDAGREHNYTIPLNAWGGIPAKLQANSTTKLKDFIEYPLQDLPVIVRDFRGQPVNGATLRIRDRMSESWRQVAEGPTTLSNAAHPIPYPPAIRIQEGRAVLPSIRAGMLELLVELDDGTVFPMTVDEDAPNPLTITLPSGGGVQ